MSVSIGGRLRRLARDWEEREGMSMERMSVWSAGWRRLASVVLVALVAAGVAGVGASSAIAGWGSPIEVGAGHLLFPLGVSVDQGTGAVYVGNLDERHRIAKFDAAHVYKEPPSPFGLEKSLYSGVAVNPTNHDLFAVDSEHKEMQEYDSSTGELLRSFPVPGSANLFGEFTAVQIASDAAGDVYLPNAPNNEVQVFSESGGAPGGVAAIIAGSGANALKEPTGVAVETSGNVWVADDGNNRIEEFEPNGAFVREIASAGVQAVAVDAAGHVFASVHGGPGPRVIEYDSSGAQIDEFGLGTLGESEIGTLNGIAIDEANSLVYVVDGQHNVVWAFTPLGARTTPATEVTLTQATLNGSVTPEGEPVTSCTFEYGKTAAYGHAVPCTQTEAEIGAGSSPVDVSAQIEGLEPDTEYHFRLRVENTLGHAAGGDEILMTVEPVFGFRLSGPDALEMLVSEGADPEEPAAGDPEKLDMQAGSHPFDVTTRFLINSESNGNMPLDLEAKDYYVNVPAGFAGSVAKIPRCKMSELSSLTNRQRPPGCPTASQIGVMRLFKGAGTGASESEVLPVYNMVAPPGAPAEFAFPYILIGEPVVFQVRSDGDYGVTAEVRNISEVLPIVGSQLTLWGVPADPRHDMERFLPERGASSNSEFIPGNKEGGPLPAGTGEIPFLNNPTACGPQPEASITADSWLHPGQLAENGRPVPGGTGWVTAKMQMYPGGIKGCGKLTFNPELKVTPTTTVADSPTGLTVELSVPQSEGANNLATPALKFAEVKLPQGLSISPSQANGLEGCTHEQIKLGSMAQPECPNGSQIGKLELTTPLLPEVLTGQIYLSSERSGSTYHVYLVIRGNGILVKLRGAVTADEQTGQLTSTFEENPQVQFSKLKLTFYAGADAALATPDACGTYRTTSLLEPWSHQPAEGEPAGTPNATPFAEPFTIDTGCVTGFAPSFVAGVTNPVAGAFSPLTLSVSRSDNEQELSGLEVKMPRGLVAKLAGVAECGGAQIAAAEHSSGTAEEANPSCPASSQIGTVQTGAGPGSTPFFISGKAYLTGPYKGAPYGIAVIVPVLAGPFDLGTVVVRSAISIDPHTAQVTVVSDPFPRRLDGIPLRIRRVDVAVNRSDFTLDPTSCEAMRVAGTLTSTGGSRYAASSRFQVGGCGSLAFKPGFKVSTKVHHTKRFGAFLRVKVTSGPGQANIKSVFVKLPKALPSRVATLKGACSEKQFAENPAGCPAASKVGSAIARTPVLATPLTGPAIFVSHGGAAFPDLDIVLQGSGITIVLEGNTNIHKNVTSSSFRSVPDVPVSSFELTLPAGPHSALAANGNLCFKTLKRGRHNLRRRVKLVMPTTITAQNGAVVRRNTHVAVKDCGHRPR